MRNLKATALALGLSVGLWPLAAAAQDFDGSKPLICSLAHVMQCEDGNDGCERLRPNDVGAPDFLNLDFQAKTITTSNSAAASAMDNVELIDDRLYVQGAEDGLENEIDGFGWTMAITQDGGQLVLSGAAEGMGFVFFGACMAVP
jgi:hypothetical protein